MALFFKSKEEKQAAEEAKRAEKAREAAHKERVEDELVKPYEEIIEKESVLAQKRELLKGSIDKFYKHIAERQVEYSARVSKKYEYLSTSTNTEGFNSETLDFLGKQGWELVSAASYEIGGNSALSIETKLMVNFQFFFKRELAELPEIELEKLGQERKSLEDNLANTESELTKLRKEKEEILKKSKEISPNLDIQKMIGTDRSKF